MNKINKLHLYSRFSLFCKSFLVCSLLIVSPARAKVDFIGFLFGDSIEKALAIGLGQLDKISEKRVSEVLKGIDGTASRTVSEGIAGGQLITVQAGNQLRVATESAALLFGAKLDEKVGELQGSYKELLAALIRLEQKVQSAGDKVIDFADLLSLDMEILAGRVLGIESAPLHLRGIKNTIFTEKQRGPDRRVEIRGPFFGADPAGVSTTYELSFDGEDLGPGVTATGLNSKHNRIITIPNRLIEKNVNLNKIVVKNIFTQIKREESKTFCRKFPFLFCSEQETISVKIPITILPKKIGTLTAKMERPEYHFVALEQPHEEAVNIRASAPIQLLLPSKPSGYNIPIGFKKFVRNSVKIICQNNIQHFRRFRQHQPGGVELPANHDMFKNGWTVKEVGPGKHSTGNNVDGPGTVSDIYSRIVRRMSPLIGKLPLAASTPLHTLAVKKMWVRLSAGKVTQDDWYHYSMTFTAQELINSSDKISKDLSGCPKQTAGTPAWKNDTQFHIPINSTTSTSALWKVSAKVLEWRVKGREHTEKIIDVKFDELVQIEVKEPESTDVNLVFTSVILGRKDHFTVGNPSKGFARLDDGNIGKSRIYKLQFKLE